MKFGNNIDLAQSQLLNARIQNLSSAPSSPVEGQIYYNTVNKTCWQWNGTAWIPWDASQIAAGSIPNTALTTNPLARANHTGTQTASTISDLATVVKAYRLDEFAAPTANVTFNSQKIINLADPTSAQDAATKNYVDNLSASAAAGIDAKASVRVIATSNLTLSAPQTIDGVSVIAGDRVLVKGQTTGSANGVYVVAAGAWTRALDADASGELTPGAFWYVEEGTTYGKTQWRIENTGAIVLGTTTITINQFGAAALYSAGNGLSLTGSVFAVVAGNGIIADGSSTRVDPSIVVRKYNALIGDGSTTNIVVTHNLGTQSIAVSINEVSTSAGIITDWAATTTNTATISFAVAPTTNQYRLNIIG